MPTAAPPAAQSSAQSPAQTAVRPAAPPAYRGLRVWQHALDLTVDAALLARALELEGLGPLAADLVRAGLAVPAHIAAGSVAPTRLDHQRALAAAIAAVARFETVLAAAERLAPNARTASADVPDGVGAYAALLAGTQDVTRSLRAFARAISGPPTARPAAPDVDAPASVAQAVAHVAEPAPAPLVLAGATHAPAGAPAESPAEGAAPEPAAGPLTLSAPVGGRPARARRARTPTP